MKIKIAELKKDGLQTRVALDERTVADYADAMREGAEFPPVMVFEESGKMWLADGFHRVEAATRAGQAYIDATVTSGKFIDALRYALKCNTRHGKRVTNEDKQNAMRIAWENREELFGGEPSANLLGETCGVSRPTAISFMKIMTEEANKQGVKILHPDNAAAPARPTMPTRKVVGLDGKQYTRPAIPTRPAEPPKPPKPIIPTDRYGVEIPKNIREAFSGDDALREIERHISEARTALERGGIALAAVRQDALVNLNNAYNFVKAAHPHCVCRMCQGRGCMACHERGFQTKEEYSRNPKEFLAE